jgi:alpha-glucosidase
MMIEEGSCRMAEPWWKTAVIYKIYPRSFQDSNGDGIGDLAGVRQRLDHLVELGVGALWLSPVQPSPMADFGYDIADYCGVDPIFGTLDDLDALIAAAHARGLKLILDLVPNHTSDRHPWFLESRGSRRNAKRDWYLWRDPAPGGGPPNNWLSEFGGSAWAFDEATGQYYYHAFLAAQPDLNWRNPEVRQAIGEVMRFWLARGVDGFRVDVLWHLIKDAEFRDNPASPDFHEGQPPPRRLAPLYTVDRPEVHAVVAELRRIVDEFDQRLLIGEIYLPLEKLVAYYGADLAGCHLPFNFSLLLLKTWNAVEIRRLIETYEALLPPGAWPNWVLGNHDQPRVASRVGREQARNAAILLLTLRGTPTLYYGDEIGMVQVDVPPDRVRDPVETNLPGLGLGRDGARTPMQWDAGRFAGFSETEPWLPLARDHRAENLENARADSASIYNLHRRLIAARRTSAALLSGDYRPIVAAGDLLIFGRETTDERVLVALNLGGDAAVLRFAAPLAGRILVSGFGDRDGEAIQAEVGLREHEGLVIALDPGSRLPAAAVGASP